MLIFNIFALNFFFSGVLLYPMHTRHKKLLEELQSKGFVSFSEAAKLAGVTEMTIRRDVRLLSGRHLVMAVKNGMIPHPAGYEPENSSLLLNPEKFSLAEALYNAIMPVQTLFWAAASPSLPLPNSLPATPAPK